jgi:uncharacterized protein YutE (UPF0331/DUF86 family)
MTPRRFDPDVVQTRLAEIDRLLRDLEPHAHVEARTLRTDRQRRHVVERILTLLVDLAAGANTHVAASQLGEVPTDYRRSFFAAAEAGAIDPELARRLAPSVGLRNLLTHAYLDVDLDRLAAAVPFALQYYADYVRQVAAYLHRAAEQPD